MVVLLGLFETSRGLGGPFKGGIWVIKAYELCSRELAWKVKELRANQTNHEFAICLLEFKGHVANFGLRPTK